MHVDILVPFTFEAVVSEGGRRNRARVVMTDAVPASILTTSSLDAPLVARIHRSVVVRPLNIKEGLREQRELCPVDIRLVGDQMYQSVPFPSNGSVEPLSLEKYLQAQTHRPKSLLRNAWPSLEHLAATAEKPRELSDTSLHIHSSSRELCCARALALAKNYMFVDGVLHRPGSEPIYAKLNNGQLVSMLLDEAKEKRIDAGRAWSAIDDTILFDYLAHLPEDQQDAQLDSLAIEVIDPSAFLFDRALALVTGGAELVLRLVHRQLLHADDDIVLRWLDLRGRLKSCQYNAAQLIPLIHDLAEDATQLGATQSSIQEALSRLDGAEIRKSDTALEQYAH